MKGSNTLSCAFARENDLEGEGGKEREREGEDARGCKRVQEVEREASWQRLCLSGARRSSLPGLALSSSYRNAQSTSKEEKKGRREGERKPSTETSHSETDLYRLAMFHCHHTVMVPCVPKLHSVVV